jgi:hypothetical protein
MSISGYDPKADVDCPPGGDSLDALAAEAKSS